MFILEQALSIHDENPLLARNLLESIVFSDLEDKEKPRYFWLVSHVIGELLTDWPGAFALLRLNHDERSDAYFKFLAVAAYYSGHPMQAFAAEFKYARLASASLVETKALVTLLCLQSARTDEPLMTSLTLLDACASSLVNPVSPVVGKSMAAALNNIVSKLIEDSRLQGDDPFHKRVTIEAALICERLWFHFGTWVNHERSLYLCALTYNRFSEWAPAVDRVEEALDVIASNGCEEVDRAFLLLELAKAQHALGDINAAGQKLDEADRIAKDFDPHLHQWFADKRAKALSHLPE